MAAPATIRLRSRATPEGQNPGTWNSEPSGPSANLPGVFGSEGSRGVWPIRAMWLVLPLIAGPVLGDALAGTSRPVQVVASAGSWGLWAGVLLATLVPRTVTLTIVRITAPAALAALAWAVGRDGGTLWWQVAALCWGALIVGIAFLPVTGQSFVNGSAYGGELRLPLRVPGALVLGPLPATWLVTVGVAAAGPLLLAARQWLAGGLVLTIGLPVAVWGALMLHRLARRWVVLVPGGIVLHDPLTLADPILLRRTALARLGAAPADTTALDLSAGALGLAIEARLQAPVSLLLVRGGGATVAEPNEALRAEALLFTPTRPGAFLAAARSRRLTSTGTPRRSE